MSEQKPGDKPKQNVALRSPKPKKKLGLSVPPALRLPHEDLIVPEAKLRKDDREGIAVRDARSRAEPDAAPSERAASSAAQSAAPAAPPVAEQQAPVAPQRDFTRVPNSINREALPAGLFVGKSKQLYDCLYALTRGAVVPVRSVRISRPKLMKMSDIGSRATFETNVERLISVGLLDVNHIPGEHRGNEYVVFVPEEIESNRLTMPSLTSLTRSAQKLVRLVRLETSQTRHSSSQAESTTYEVPKTFFKTHDDDTHTTRDFSAAITEAARAVVGGELKDSEQERRRWRRLGELLADELRSAAANTEAISSAPAFFEAHLRRKLNVKTAAPGEDAGESATAESASERKRFEPARKSKREPGRGSDADAPEGGRRTNARSEFTLEECRLYAEHLKATGQGITNPGGFATKIHRSGEADAAIRAHLDERASRTETARAADCPDCHGTGYRYPQGIGKGVVKCRHERLRATAEEASGVGDAGEGGAA